MKRSALILIILLSMAGIKPAFAQEGDKIDMDTFTLGHDTLNIHFYGHASLMLEYNDLKVYVDPFSRYADYSILPKADIILVTHEHGDHLDTNAIARIRKDNTVIIANAKSGKKIKNSMILNNGETSKVEGIAVEAVPAYNTTFSRRIFHPKGNGNGYIVTFGDKQIYIAGDTEVVPEMKKLKDIYIAFLPVNQPYTMTVKQAARAARIIAPDILYPYHFGNTNITKLKELLSKESDIEVRIRSLQ